MAEDGSDFYQKLNENQNVVLATAGRVVISEGFYGGMGINNALAIDFYGQINSARAIKTPFPGSADWP